MTQIDRRYVDWRGEANVRCFCHRRYERLLHHKATMVSRSELRLTVAEYRDVLSVSDLQRQFSESIEENGIDAKGWNQIDDNSPLLSRNTGTYAYLEYEWKLYSNAHPDANEGLYVEERQFTRRRWRNFFGFSGILLPLFVFFGITPGSISLDPLPLVDINLPIMAEGILYLPLIALQFLPLGSGPSIVVNTADPEDSISQGTDSPYPLAALSGIAAISSVIIMLLFFPWFHLIATGALLAMIGVHIIFLFKPALLNWKWDVDTPSSTSIPSVARNYAMSMVTTSLGIFISLGLTLDPITGVLTTYPVVRLGAVVLLVAILATTFAAYHDIFPESHDLKLSQFIEATDQAAETVQRSIPVYKTVGLTASVGYVLVGGLAIYLISTPYRDDPVLMYLPVLFLSYYFVGFVYQTANFASTYLRILTGDPLDHNLETRADVLVSESVQSATAITTLNHDYILVSDTLVDRLDERPLDAVIAHEDAHIRNGDTRLAVTLNILSPVLLTGVNVLYTVYNFTAREIQADRLAADTVGKQHLLDALEELEEQSTPSPASGKHPGLLPFSPLPDNRLMARYFGEFFGSFGLSQAHPPIDRRKQLIQEL